MFVVFFPLVELCGESCCPQKGDEGRVLNFFWTGHKTFKYRLRFWRVAFTPTPLFFIGDIVSLDYKHVDVTMVGMVEVIHHWNISKNTGSKSDMWLIHAVVARCKVQRRNGPNTHPTMVTFLNMPLQVTTINSRTRAGSETREERRRRIIQKLLRIQLSNEERRPGVMKFQC